MTRNPVVALIIIINYYLYRFYQRWYPAPTSHAVQVAAFLLTINVGEVAAACGAFPPPGPDTPPYPPTGLVLLFLLVLGLMGALSYFLVFYKDRDRDLFLAMSHGTVKARKTYFFVFWTYFLLTVGPLALFFFVKVSNLK